MLHDLTTDKCEGCGAVVLRLRFWTFFVNWTNTGVSPVILYFTLAFTVVIVSEHGCYLIVEFLQYSGSKVVLTSSFTWVQL